MNHRTDCQCKICSGIRDKSVRVHINLSKNILLDIDKVSSCRAEFIRNAVVTALEQTGTLKAHYRHIKGTLKAHNCSEVNDSNDMVESAKKLSTTPCGQIVDNLVRLYNTILCDLNQVKMITESRKSAINARWNEDKNRQNEGWWCEYYNRVKRSDFLMGRVSGDRVWRADFDWLIKPSNMVKVIEGRYDNKRGVDKYESAAELDPDEIMKSMFSRWDNIDNGGETKLLTAGEVDGQE